MNKCIAELKDHSIFDHFDAARIANTPHLGDPSFCAILPLNISRVYYAFIICILYVYHMHIYSQTTQASALRVWVPFCVAWRMCKIVV